MASGPLDGIRVVDAATARGELAGRVLADLGAEVIKLEPPGGAEARRRPPFADGREGDPDASLYWAAVARGKHSVVLDPLAPGGASHVRELLHGADVFIESFEPGALAAVGLDYASLAADCPALVYASITPFGQDGPLARAPATDLTIEAASSLLGLQGPADRPPVPVGYPQASFHAAAQAAADVCCALYERLRSGLGQHLDVSAQAAMIWTTLHATGFPPLEGRDPPGTGATRSDKPLELMPGVRLPSRFACADGYAQVALPVPGIGERTLHTVLRWAEHAGELPRDLMGRDWTRFIADCVAGTLDAGTLQRAFDAMLAFLAKRSKREIQEVAVAERVLLAPVYNMADLRADPQLAARGYWTDVAGRTHPGPFAQLSETPLRVDRPAPALGADQRLLRDVRRRDPVRAGEPSTDVFSGLKVADFSWAATGPLMAKALADHGATVVHVESAAHLDTARGAPPFQNGERDIDRAFMYANFNTSKLGLVLDLSTRPGAETARRLVDWADVYIESFTPGTMARFGLDWETVSATRDDLVMVSTSLRGQTGPERRYAGFGSQGVALAGIESVTGWPDRPPTSVWGAYTDFIATRYGLATLASALLHRAKTGRGQWIDLAQVEAAIHFLEPLVLDYTTNGCVAGLAGHGSLYACPHGVFRTAGHERYVAIAVETPEQWDALCARAPLGAFGDAGYRPLAARLGVRAEIEAALAVWCADRDAFDLADALRATGVPAYTVMRPSDLGADPQLMHRGFFVTVDHSAMGSMRCDGFATRYSRTPARLRSGAPTLGEHTQYVLRELLGLSDDAISDLALAGALS